MSLPRIVVPSIEKLEAHVWKLHDPENIAAGLEIISRAENAHAQTYRFPKDQRRFIACRTLLRLLLGAYGFREPKEIALVKGRNGKPRECKGSAHFNISHCDGMAIFAFSNTGEVGIDVERVRSLPDAHDLIRRYAPPEDFVHFQNLPAEQQDGAFFRWWTVREAQAKCDGEGLQALERPLNLSHVLMSPFEELSLTVERRLYRIFACNPAEGFVGALCSSSETRSLRIMDATPFLRQEASCSH